MGWRDIVDYVLAVYFQFLPLQDNCSVLWRTFWSFETGWETSQSYFLDNVGNDEARIIIFSANLNHWKSLEGEVKAWSLSNWRRWEVEKPDWFTPLLKASVPDSFNSSEMVDALGGLGRARRGSANLGGRVIETAGLMRRLSKSDGKERVEDAMEEHD